MAILVVSITSCTMTKRHYAPGYHVEWRNFSKHETPLLATQPKQTSKTDEVSAEPTSEIALNLDLPPVTGSVSASASVNQQEINTPLTNKRVVAKEWASVKEKVAENFQKLSEQSYVAKVHSSKGPDGLSWLIWVAAILFIPVFGGPIFILVWTAKNNGQPEWKPILLSLLCYLLCWIPGVIYDIIWIKKNCSGSLF